MLTIEVHTITEGRLHLVAPFGAKDTIKSIAGREWNKYPDGCKKWSIPATSTSVGVMYKKLGSTYELKLCEIAVGLLRDYIEQSQSTVHKTATDLPDPGFTKTPLWGHQKQAVHFGMGKAGVMFAMGMGTGKTLATIAMLDGRKATSAVILCPRRAVPVWPREFRDHSKRDWYVIAPPQKATVNARAAFIARGVQTAKAAGRPYAVCVNTEASWRPGMAQLLSLQQWDFLVVDESHRIKAPGGKASRYAAKLRKSCRWVILNTGTPMPHSPLDIFAQYRVLDPHVFGTNFGKFRNRYAIMGGFENRQVVGYQNVEELNEMWGEHAFICGEEVLDLPPYHHVRQTTELEPKARKVYNQLDQDFVAMCDDSIIVGDNALTKLLRLQQMTSGWVKDEDERLVQVSTAKAELLEEVMEDFAEHEPLVVCCRFQSDLETVKQLCIKQGRRYGEISGRVSETSPEYGLNTDARMRDDIDVVAVQIQAGGVGIDLTRAAYNIMYSVGYSLGDYEQFLKRTHRPGQTRPTTYIHLVIKDTKDEAVYEALTERKNVVDAMIELARKS